MPRLKENEEIEGYIIKRKIGEGGNGFVYLAIKKNDINNIELAIKEIELTKPGVSAEKSIHEKINKRNAINLDKMKDYFIRDGYIYFVSTYYNGGTLREYLNNCKTLLNIKEIQYIIKQIINGLRILNDEKIIHRDIKPENLLINYDSDQDLKNKNILKSTIIICDYGAGKIIHKTKDKLTKSDKGTIIYRHPKLNEKYFCEKNDDSYLNAELDIWSVGIICLELFSGKQLYKYNNKEPDKFKEQLKRETYDIPLNENTSVELVSFIDKTLQYEQKNQILMVDLLKEPFINNEINAFTPFPKEKAGKKMKNINDKEYIELNFKNGLNFNYNKLFKKVDDRNKELNELINKCFVDLNKNTLFTDQVLIPVILDSKELFNE